MQLLKDKRAVVKFSFLIVGLIAVLGIVLFANGVSANTHTSSVELTPEWSPADSDVDYTVTFCKLTGDTINEVRIYKNYEGSIDYTDFSCEEKAGWELLYISSYPACFYVADETSEDYNPLNENGECADFYFSAHTPEQDPQDPKCALDWRFETRDDNDYWTYLYDTTSVDMLSPIITKDIIGPQQGDCPPTPGTDEECWIMDHETEIIVSVEDQGLCDPPSGIDYCYYSIDLDGQQIFTHTFDPEPIEDPTEIISWKVIFEEDSVHTLYIKCVDLAGNEVEDTEVFRVDSTPPTTEKELGEPKVVDGFIEWISTSTPITLYPEDGGEICAIGVDKTWYVNDVYEGAYQYCWEPEKYCNSQYFDTETPYDMEIEEGCINEIQESCTYDFEENTENWYDCVEQGAYNVCGVEYWKLYRGEPITKDEESCHILRYFSIDDLGNIEDVKYNCFFVDDTTPIIKKNNDERSIRDIDPDMFPETDGVFHWVTPEHKIDFYCEDQGEHPSHGEELLFKISYDLDSDGYVTEKYCEKYNGEMEEDWCVVPIDPSVNNHFGFNFNEDEDSIHDLEYFCRDGVGKVSGEPHIQYYKVDSTPPTITPEIYSGPTYGTCDLNNPEADCWIQDTIGHEGTYIHTNAIDGGEICAVDEIYCEWSYWLDGEFHGSGFQCEGEDCYISFEDETEHELIVECWDKLENKAEYTKNLYVDSSGPEVEKIISDPKYIIEGDYGLIEWIDSATTISLEATDYPDAPCAVGQEEIYYVITPMEDEACWEPENYCYNAQYEEGAFTLYTEPIGDIPESCHRIEFYGIDALGNIGPMGKNCFFVDKTPPITTKTYKPVAYIDPTTGYEYIDTIHQIILRSVDYPEAHPSGVKDTFYTVTLMDDNSACENVELCIPMHTWEDDVWNTYEEPFGIDEESCHMIEYYSIDNVDKKEPVKPQCVFVDKQGPTIEKTYNGPQYPDPIEADTPYPHYINSETLVNINAYDNGPHPSGVESVEYRVTLLQGNEACESEPRCQEVQVGEESWTPYVEPFTIDEDSCHLIEIIATDNVGKFSTHKQCVFVDNKEPIIQKTITGPEVDGQTPIHKYLTDESTIRLECADQDPHPVGNEIINWEMYWKYDNCEVDEDWVLIEEGQDSEFKEFTGLKDSCHKFVYWCKDALGNTQVEPEVEIDIVDNQAPIPNKTVGEVKIIWDGLDAVFYDLEEFCSEPGKCWKVTMDTPITLDCVDPQPHPVDNEKTCFKVELDAEDATPEYCETYGVRNDEGWCCTNEIIEDFHFLEESEHNLAYYCVDELGNGGPEDQNWVVDDEKFKVYGRMFEIQLNKKWNLISVPFNPLDKDPEVVFSEVKDNVEAVYTYNGETDHWYMYRPDESSNDLEKIETGNGYWVMATDDDMLVVGGSLYQPGPTTPPSKKLIEGWNLIGYYGTEGEEGYYGPDNNGNSAYCTLYSLRNLDGGLFKPTNWNSLLTYWELDNPDQWYEYGLCDEMDPGAGYWIAMDTEDTYNPETVCENSILGEICDIF
ncbi:MAG: hypothetical protein KKF48_02310 [Nanoarchaeota archaeon]|nr:hypothetical protein [Nanoarchaeota archaeon]MBU1027853.1 hypothetical protein [Nanoarchaeota archaeon]